MSTLSGWNLAGRLVNKHFGSLGNSIASAIAGFDPETATEADRDALASRLRDIASKYSQAETAFKKEQKDVIDLSSQINQDMEIAGQLSERLASGSVDEETVNLFLDELEAAKARLPQEEAEAVDAKEFRDELKNIIDAVSEQLTQFDAHAKKAKRELEQARLRMDQQNMRAAQQNELRAMAGNGAPSTALSALQARAAKIKAQADGLRVLNDVTDRPAQNKAKIDDLRKSVLIGENGRPSTAERLKALTESK